MSLATDRAAIATALSGVSGIAAYDDIPAAPTLGDAWVRWGGSEAQGQLIFTVTWRIFIACGQEPGDAMTFADSKVAAVVEAIDEIVWVDSVAPIFFEDLKLHALEISTHKEN